MTAPSIIFITITTIFFIIINQIKKGFPVCPLWCSLLSLSSSFIIIIIMTLTTIIMNIIN